MSANKNFNIKGDTNVEQESIIRDAEIKGTAESMEWDDFQLIGANDSEERRYAAPAEADKALAELKRAKKLKIGQSILSILNYSA